MFSVCLSLDAESFGGLSIDMASGSLDSGRRAALLFCKAEGDFIEALLARAANLLGLGLRADLPLPLPPVLGTSSLLEDMS